MYIQVHVRKFMQYLVFLASNFRFQYGLKIHNLLYVQSFKETSNQYSTVLCLQKYNVVTFTSNSIFL